MYVVVRQLVQSPRLIIRKHRAMPSAIPSLVSDSRGGFACVGVIWGDSLVAVFVGLRGI